MKFIHWRQNNDKSINTPSVSKWLYNFRESNFYPDNRSTKN